MLTHAPMPVFNAFAPAGRGFTYATIPGALPRAVCSLGFQPAYGNDGVSLQISENPKLYAVFQIPEGGILRSKRPPFSLQYAVFRRLKRHLLQTVETQGSMWRMGRCIAPDVGHRGGR